MIGFFKKLITGVLNFFIGLVGGKKNGYYLELDEAAEEASIALDKATSKVKEVAQETAASAKKAVDTATSKAQEVVETATSNTQQAADTATSKAKELAGTATANTQKVAETAKSNTKKAAQKVTAEAPASTNGKKDPNSKAQPKADEVVLVQSGTGVRAEPSKEDKTSAQVLQQPQTETTFAPKYLIPTNTNGRRRPGANMNSYLDMARQVKTPK